MNSWLKRIDRFLAKLEYYQGWAQPKQQPLIKIEVSGIKALGADLAYATEQAIKTRQALDKMVLDMKALGHDVPTEQFIEWHMRKPWRSIHDSAQEIKRMAMRGEPLPWQ